MIKTLVIDEKLLLSNRLEAGASREQFVPVLTAQ